MRFQLESQVDEAHYQKVTLKEGLKQVTIYVRFYHASEHFNNEISVNDCK